MNYKLGKLAPKHDRRTLRMTDFIDDSVVIKIPDTYTFEGNVGSWGMLANDKVGDCTIASALHIIKAWLAYRGVAYNPTDADAIAIYRELTGYDPADPSTDNGAALLDIAKAWRNQGILGHKIGAFMTIDPTNIDQVKLAIYMFGCVYAGVTITQMAQVEYERNAAWECTSPRFCLARVMGGHAVPWVGYGEDFIQTVTWGKLISAKYAWVQKYSDEAIIPVGPEFVSKDRPAPNGFRLDQLLEAAQSFTSYMPEMSEN